MTSPSPLKLEPRSHTAYQTHPSEQPPLSLSLPSPDNEVAFLRATVARLGEQVEEQGALMDDMAGELRRRRPQNTSSSSSPFSGDLPVEVHLLQARVREAEAQRERAESERDLHHRTALQANSEVTSLRAQCEDLQRSLRVMEPSHARVESDPLISNQMTNVVAKLRRDLHESERAGIRDRAERLGEARLVSMELAKVSALAVTAMESIGELSRASHFLPKHGEVAAPPRSTAESVHSHSHISQMDQSSHLLRTASHATSHISAVETTASTVDAEEAVLCATTNEAWEASMYRLIEVATQSTVGDASVRRSYLERLSQGLELRLSREDPQRKMEAGEMRREADRALSELQKENNASVTHLVKVSQELQRALEMIGQEAQASCEVFGIQSRALHHFREQCLITSRSKDVIVKEVERLQESLASEALSTGHGIVELRHRNSELETELERLKSFMDNLKLSDIDITALRSIGIDPDED